MHIKAESPHTNPKLRQNKIKQEAHTDKQEAHNIRQEALTQARSPQLGKKPSHKQVSHIRQEALTHLSIHLDQKALLSLFALKVGDDATRQPNPYAII